MEKNCKTCKYNVEYPPPHTCDVCTSLDAEEEYEMWQPVKTCLTCEHNDKIYDNELNCFRCVDYSNYIPIHKEETKKDSLKDEFYLRLVCNIDGKEIEVSKIRLTDLVNKMTADMVDSFCKSIKMK